MTDYIETYQQAVDSAMNQYMARNTPENIEAEAWRKHVLVPDPITVPSPEMLEQTKSEIAKQIAINTQAAIDLAKQQMQREVENEQAQLDRITMHATTGRSLVEQFAAQHKISFEQAKAELDDYAAMNPRNLTDAIKDRYAGIRNAAQLTGDDQRKAGMFLQDEFRRLGIDERRQRIKTAQYLMSDYSTMNNWNSSGAALYRQTRTKQNSD